MSVYENVVIGLFDKDNDGMLNSAENAEKVRIEILSEASREEIQACSEADQTAVFELWLASVVDENHKHLIRRREQQEISS